MTSQPTCFMFKVGKSNVYVGVTRFTHNTYQALVYHPATPSALSRTETDPENTGAMCCQTQLKTLTVF